MVQINFLFIYFNMHLHRYLFKVLRIILPEILNIMITSYKILFSHSICIGKIITYTFYHHYQIPPPQCIIPGFAVIGRQVEHTLFQTFT